MRAEKVVLYIRHQVKDSSGNFYDAEKMDFEYNVVHFHDGEMIQKADVKGQHFVIDGDWFFIRYEI